MAYLFQDELLGSAPTMWKPAATAALSPIEARVVELAMTDRLSSLATSAWRRTLTAMLGVRPAQALASPRLEALRRFVVLARHARVAAQDELARLLTLGFTREQLSAVETRIAAAR